MSSETLSRQAPINTTVTPWQQLKDHVRTVCSSVERVEVFGGSTSGWVSVHGRENFDAAMGLLNGGLFNDRYLVADGRNATQATVIKDLNCSLNALPQTSTQHSPSSPAVMSPMGTESAPWTSSASPCALSQTRDYQPHAAPYDYGGMSGWWPPEAAAGNYADQQHLDAVMTEPRTYETSYHHNAQQYQVGQDPSNCYAWHHEMADPNYRSSRPYEPTGIVHTTKRKIIIKQLPTWVLMNQVEDLIRQKTGLNADKVQQIDLPLADGSGLNRGYALVTLQNEEDASRVIRKLQGYEYDGRVLSVKHTKEGVSENESSGSRANKPRRDGRDKKERKESPSQHSSTADKKSIKSHHGSGVVIAHGSSSVFKKVDDKDKKPSRKH
ncbi:hypothetical protein DL764_006035 [Monosporascus ibericus]|uniref:RRM domain-containing protein n=1 Tax=Monosporascus ibericus TaxID=155417 RepID=A0A4Q4T6G1_9PEZI|nr:hypothetical protein DL764_006035 [Monosporascus ibericus]